MTGSRNKHPRFPSSPDNYTPPPRHGSSHQVLSSTSTGIRSSPICRPYTGLPFKHLINTRPPTNPHHDYYYICREPQDGHSPLSHLTPGRPASPPLLNRAYPLHVAKDRPLLYYNGPPPPNLMNLPGTGSILSSSRRLRRPQSNPGPEATSLLFYSPPRMGYGGSSPLPAAKYPQPCYLLLHQPCPLRHPHPSKRPQPYRPH